ncbi:uncharacterized protein LOC122040973 [Zingiber officinale]|uniref:Uncharacterized protein n=1 Tax=Zingiber officinale TaxID=94328 RepID=A0A8J5LYL0_ZINOF|nr:uncharacterized protein LOC122040973 [Zingiber officinale]KAG6527569.1 hypothetical protein ZIOFF_009680 [Zingiber officinale]
MDPEKGDHPKSERKEEEKQVKRRESVLSSDGDDGDEDEDDFFQLDQEIMNPFLGHVNDGGRVGAADGSLSYPPIQMMWRSPEAADPNRIPSSIFAGPSSPMEWSAASNESLFSIHGGNSSFTRDHVTLMEKSGELNLPAEDHHHHHHHHPHPQALRDVAGTETDNAKSIKELVQANLEEQQHRSSDCSAVSYQSFAFPILAGEGRTGSVKVESVHPFRPSKSQQKQPPMAAAPKSASLPPTSTSPEQKSKWIPCACLLSFCSQGKQ